MSKKCGQSQVRPVVTEFDIIMKNSRKGTVKMENLYILRKQKGRIVGRRILKWICQVGIVVGCIAFFGIWGGMEFGPIMIGRRLLWTGIDAVAVALMAAGWTVLEGR